MAITVTLVTDLDWDGLAALLVDGLVGGALHVVALLLVAGGALLLVLGPVAGLGHRPALAAVGGAALVVVDRVVDGLALGAVARGDSADQGD